tara:strand:+ start:6021 stop:8462 length:2442 start_codon:yes stop_codon:yes gene_type:complete
MMNPMNRPMFNAPMPSAEGVGITSGLTDPMQQEQMVTEQGLGQVAGGVQDMFNKIDASETPEETINAIRGDNASMEERYNELAMYVGKEDAEQTPETVLTLVQPTLTILEVAQQAPEGGISDVPIQAPGTEEASMRIAMGEQPIYRQSGSTDAENVYDNIKSHLPYGKINSTSTDFNIGNYNLNTPYLSSNLSPPPLLAINPSMVKDYSTQYMSLMSPYLEALTGGSGPGVDASIAQLSPYLPKKRSSEEILQEYQEMFGESDRDSAKTQGFLELMKMGANIAQSPENLLQAATAAAGESAPGFQKIASDLSEKERALKLASIQESKEIDRTRQAQEISIANAALARNASAQNNVEQAILAAQKDAVNKGILQSQAEVKKFNDTVRMMWQANNQFAALGSETWAKVITSEGKSKIDVIGVRRFQDTVKYLDPETNDWVKVPAGYVPYDKNALAASNPNAAVDLSEAKKIDKMLLPDPTGKSKTGYNQYAGFYLNGSFWYTPGGGGAPKLAPRGFLIGGMNDAIEISEADGGRIFATIKVGPRQGQRFLTKIEGLDDSLGFAYELQIPVRDANNALLSGDPLVKTIKSPGIPYAHFSNEQVNKMHRKIIANTKAIAAGEEVLSLIGDAIGPYNSIKDWTSNWVGGFSPDSWSALVDFAATARGRQAMNLWSRELIAAVALSDRFAVKEQEMIKELAQDPKGFWKSAKMSEVKFVEILRNLQNELSYNRGLVEEKLEIPYLTAMPTGTANDPFLFSGHGQYDTLMILSAKPGGKARLAGKFIRMTKAEAVRQGLGHLVPQGESHVDLKIGDQINF